MTHPEIGAPETGDYVLRVIDFASTTPTYELTATLFDSANLHLHQPGENLS